MSTVETTRTESPKAKPVASSSKKSRKKKKHVSKHVLQAKADAEKAAALVAARSEESSPAGAQQQSQKKKKKREVIKDPEEASNYLKSWQAKEGWKFQKNTQSWLIRHMYETEKVSKSTFTILLDYIKGLQGEDAKRRILEEATARAKRYRDYEKKQKMNTTEMEAKVMTATASPDDDDKKQQAGAGRETPPPPTTGDNQDDGYGLQHWLTLDDHDKRKEYKRARRLLEVLTEAMKES